MPRLACTAAAFSLFLVGCLDGADPDTTPTPPPAQDPEVSGLYHSLAHWDLSSAITEHPGAGTVVADLIVEQVVGLAGVPGPLQDAARAQVAAAIHAPIRDYVDAQVPDDVLPDSALLTDLAAILAEVAVESNIELAMASRDPERITGTETVTAMRLQHGERSLHLPVDVLELGDASLPIGAFLDGTRDANTTITFETHELVLRVDVLLAYAATELLGALDAEALAEQVADALACDSIVDHITGGSDAFRFEIGGMSFSLGIDALLDGCDVVRDEVVDHAFGIIDPALGVAVGGAVRALDTDGDALVDRLVSDAGYSGSITAVPLPTPTRFNASFAADRAGQ